MDLKACQEILEKDFKQKLQVIHKKENGHKLQIELHTLLHSVVEFGMTEFLEKQIDSGLVDINFRNPNGLALIHKAVSSNQLEIVQLLIKHGADLNWIGNGYPLHLATFFGFDAIAKLLLENGADPNDAVHGVKPLHFAVCNNDFETIDLLLKKTTNVDPKDANGWTPLHRAIQSNRKEIVEFLIAKGANIEMSTLSGIRPLHIAAFNGFIEIVEILIENGATLEVEDSEGFTPLHLAVSHQNIPHKMNFTKNQTKFEKSLMAIYYGASSKQDEKSKFQKPEMVRISLVKMLIKHGALVNVQNGKKITPSDYAKYLVRHNAFRDVPSGFKHAYPINTYPIHTASKNGHVKMVKLLFEHGAFVNVIDKDLYTPLSFAVIQGHFDVVDTLLEHGANVNQKDFKYCTPIHHALLQGFLEIAKLLLENGAEVSAKNDDDNTPLILAIRKNYVEMSKLLIENGANINAMNLKDERPISIAVQNGNLEATKLLIQNGAELNFDPIYHLTPLQIAVSDGIDIFRIKKDIVNCILSGIEIPHYPLERNNIPEEIVELLMRNGANVDIKKKSSNLTLDSITVFHIAMVVNIKVLPKLLSYSKMDINIRLFNNETLLHFAIRLGLHESIPILIQNGASLNTKNARNTSPLELALKINEETPNAMKQILNLQK